MCGDLTRTNMASGILCVQWASQTLDVSKWIDSRMQNWVFIKDFFHSLWKTVVKSEKMTKVLFEYSLLGHTNNTFLTYSQCVETRPMDLARSGLKMLKLHHGKFRIQWFWSLLGYPGFCYFNLNYSFFFKKKKKSVSCISLMFMVQY